MLTSSRYFIVIVALLSWIACHYWVLNVWFDFSSSLSAWDSILSVVLIASCSAALSNGLLNYVPTGGKLWFVLAPSLVLAILCFWITQKGLEQVGADDGGYLSFLDQSRPIRFAFSFIVITAVSVSTIFYGRLKEQQEVAARKEATAAMIKEAELQKLQLQLQPHFLFNSLNSINALIVMKPDEARKMVLHLSDFLRTTIKRADEHWITLADEWNYLQLYLEIEKVRFGHRLDVEANFQPESFTWKIPTLLLQPVVENAIKFGLYGTTENITISLDAFVEKGMLHFIIANPFDPESRPSTGGGFGLNGIKRRLYLLYARNDLIETQVRENLFTVSLKIPQTT